MASLMSTYPLPRLEPLEFVADHPDSAHRVSRTGPNLARRPTASATITSAFVAASTCIDPSTATASPLKLRPSSKSNDFPSFSNF